MDNLLANFTKTKYKFSSLGYFKNPNILDVTTNRNIFARIKL